MISKLQYKLLFEEKMNIQKQEQQHTNLVKALAKDSDEIKFAKRKRKITKVKRNIERMKNQILEAI